MIVKTKKHQLEKNTYIKIALVSALLQFWYALPIPFVIGAIGFAYPKYWVWFVVIAVVVAVSGCTAAAPGRSAARDNDTPTTSPAAQAPLRPAT